MDFVEKIRLVLSKPTDFFTAIKDEKGVGEAFKYFAILSVITLVVNIVGAVFSIDLLTSSLGALIPQDILSPGIVAAIVSYVLGLGLSFVGAGIIHLGARLLKGIGDYSASYKATIYGYTPYLLLGWIPFVGIIFGLYSLYLSIKGVSILHQVSIGRALIIVFVIPLVIVLIITGILASVAFFYISSLFVPQTILP